jgi:hypothetical protein
MAQITFSLILKAGSQSSSLLCWDLHTVNKQSLSLSFPTLEQADERQFEIEYQPSLAELLQN